MRRKKMRMEHAADPGAKDVSMVSMACTAVSTRLSSHSHDSTSRSSEAGNNIGKQTFSRLKCSLYAVIGCRKSLKKKVSASGGGEEQGKGLTVREDVSRQVEIQLTDGDIDVVGVDTEAGMETEVRLFQSLAVRRLQRNCLEKDDHDEVQAPHFVRLTETVDPPHLPLLIRVREDAGYVLLPRDPVHKVFPALLCDVFPQFSQQTRSPLLFHVNLFVL